MATAWDSIDETFRSYLTECGISAADFNGLSAVEKATVRNYFLLQQQQNGKLRCCCRILVFKLLLLRIHVQNGVVRIRKFKLTSSAACHVVITYYMYSCIRMLVLTRTSTSAHHLH
jgi:hypothetical protein